MLGEVEFDDEPAMVALPKPPGAVADVTRGRHLSGGARRTTPWLSSPRRCTTPTSTSAHVGARERVPMAETVSGHACLLTTIFGIQLWTTIGGRTPIGKTAGQWTRPSAAVP